MAGLTYNDYVTQMCELAVVPSTTVAGVVQSTDDNFNTILPSAIDYAELRIQRDLDLFHSVKSSTSYTTASSSRTVSLTENDFVTIQNINVITPAGTSNPASGTVVPLAPVSKEYIQQLYPSAASAGVPLYFAMLNDHTVFIGPWPNTAYTLEIIGTSREKSLGPTDTTTTATSNWMSMYVPDMLLMASMIYVSGYQRNFGRQSDDPQMAQSYESQYQALLKSAMVEEFRKKFQSSGWTSYSPSPIATPTRG
jgi:hypothetical protein